ncbi:MAG: Secretion system C-terminal sorting domain [Bacteroidota bacterium]|jgi:hypothetical protein
MKNRIFVAILWLLGCAFSAQAQFSNTYGDAANNSVNRVKRRGDFIYMAGTRTGNDGRPHATLSKIEAITGNINWTTVLDSVTTPLDFEYIETDPDLDPSGFYMIGYKGVIQAGTTQPDNQSFLCRLDANGNVDWVRVYDLPARRESFNRIIRVTNPGAIAASYYISGTVNNDAETPDLWDFGRILQMDLAGNITNWWAYHETNQIDMDSEFGSRLISWGGNQVLLGGNFVDNTQNPNRHGVLYTVNIPAGTVNTAVRFPNNMMVTDVFRLPITGPTRLIVTGYNNSDNISFIACLDANFTTLWSYNLPQFRRLDDIGRDNAGNLFVAGRDIDNLNNALCRFELNATGIESGTIHQIDPQTNDMVNSPARVWIRGGSDILYADSRTKGSGLGFQGQDIHLARFDNLLDGYECDTTLSITLDSVQHVATPYNITRLTLADALLWNEKGTAISYDKETDGCNSVPNTNCCSFIEVKPSQEQCNGSILNLSQLPPDCTVESVEMSITGGASIPNVQAFYGMGCGTENFGPGSNMFTFYPQCVTNQLVVELNIPPGGPVVLTYVVHFVGSSEVCIKKDTLDCCCPFLEFNTSPTGQVFVSQLTNCLKPNWQIGVQLTNGSFVGGNIGGGGSCLSPTNIVSGSSNHVFNASCAFVPNFSFFVQPINPNLPTEIVLTAIQNGEACSSTSGSLLFCEQVCHTEIDFTPEMTCPGDLFSHIALDISNQSSINNTICSVTITASDVVFGDWLQGNIALSGTSVQNANGNSITFVPNSSGSFMPGQTANFWITYPANPGFSGTINVQVDYCNSEGCDTSYIWNPSGGVGPGNNNGNLGVKAVVSMSQPLHWAQFLLDKSIPPVGPKKVKAIGINLLQPTNTEIVGVSNTEVNCGGTTSLLGIQLAQNDLRNARFVLDKELRAENLSGKVLSIIYKGATPQKVHVVFYDAYGSVIHQNEMNLSQVVTGVNSPVDQYSDLEMKGYPNPVQDQYTITYNLPESEEIVFDIQNQYGQTIRKVVQGKVDAGINQAILNVGDLPAGIYFVRPCLQLNGKILGALKMIVIR